MPEHNVEEASSVVSQSETWPAALLELNDRMRDETDPGTMAFISSEVVARSLGATAAGYGTMDPDEDGFVIERDWCAPGISSIVGRYRMQDFGTYIHDLRRGEDVVISDVRLDPRTVDTVAALEGAGGRTFINLPIIENGRMVAVFFVLGTSPRQWKAEELAFIRDAAVRTRTAIERRRAENKLKVLNASLEQQVAERTAQLRLYGDIVQSSAAPICAFDTEYRLIAFNQAHSDEFFRIFAHRVQLGEVFPDLFPPDQAPVIRGFMARALKGEAYTVTEEFGDPDLAKPYWEVSYSPLRDDEGRVVGAFHYALDISARLRAQAELDLAQEALRQSQKMEAVGQLTGGLAHDFNNLLAGISGSLELMSARIRQGRVAEVDKYMVAAQGAARRAAALTHRLLAFSRRQTLTPKPTNVNNLASGMLELIQRTVGPGVQVELVGTAGAWPALVDPSQLENALLNLCINARDAMPDGGRITIETGNRWIDRDGAKQHDMPEGQYLSLCVSDTGTGMTKDVIAKAFDPFFTTKPIGMGTGLGLSMIYGFAKQSGGQVRIYSEVGQGTMVCIYLPRFRGEAGADEAAAELDVASSTETGLTVLVVDDEPTVRLLVTDVLEDMGYTVIEAADSAGGLRVLQSNARIDLLISDVGLPGGMNGRQMVDAAHLHRPHLKVLFITGFAENAVLNSGQLEPGMSVLTKPFAVDKLVARVEDLLNNA